ncbi:MAG TPA: histidine kinase dimerization/phospho-acceptor domain-containing protein, partial [Gammaproteobacteria bacterium]
MPATSLEDILDCLVTAVVRLDAEGRVAYLNPAAADLLESSPRHARGRSLRELLPVDENLEQYVARALARAEPLAVAELGLYCGAPPGRRRHVTCDILPLDGGAVQIELQLLDRRQRIAEETGLWQNHQAQRLLFQSLAHEIKNPLSGLRGAAQLLAADAGDDVPREYLDIMLRETDRLRDLVDALLGPARAPRFTRTNIHAVLEHVCGLL